MLTQQRTQREINYGVFMRDLNKRAMQATLGAIKDTLGYKPSFYDDGQIRIKVDDNQAVNELLVNYEFEGRKFIVFHNGEENIVDDEGELKPLVFYISLRVDVEEAKQNLLNLLIEKKLATTCPVTGLRVMLAPEDKENLDDEIYDPEMFNEKFILSEVENFVFEDIRFNATIEDYGVGREVCIEEIRY